MLSINKTVLLVLTTLLLMSGCGFKPRGSGYESLSGQTVYLNSENPYGDLERSIRERLINSSLDVRYGVAEKSNENTIQHTIKIIQISEKKKVISVDNTGRPAEYETVIETEVIFYWANNIEQQETFSVRRDYQYNSNDSLAHDREIKILTKEMYDELALRIVDQFLRQTLVAQPKI